MSAADPAGLEDGLRALGLDLASSVRASLLRHLDLVREANRTTNLTGITDPEAMVRDHVLDSLAVLPALASAGFEPPAGTPYLDVGTGAGFPGIPIALARPDLRVVLAESRGPKARFLSSAVRSLGLGARITVRARRARELHHHHPEDTAAFAFVTVRAVANLARVLREVKSLVAPGGLVVHYKGPGLDAAERSAGAAAAEKFGFATSPDLASPMPGRERSFVVHRRA